MNALGTSGIFSSCQEPLGALLLPSDLSRAAGLVAVSTQSEDTCPAVCELGGWRLTLEQL